VTATTVLLMAGLMLLAVTPVLAQVPVLAPAGDACCISVAEYFRMRDSLVVQLAQSQGRYQALRDSLEKKAPQMTLELTLGPGVFYSFEEKQVVSGLGVTIGVRLVKFKIF
jgi:PHD/YefM family antitoxin component YafN of YafNO toxin-antitoxin module